MLDVAKKTRTARATKRPDPLRALSDDLRVQVFHRLVGDPAVRKLAQEIAEELLGGVSVDEVAQDVSDAISGADVEEVYGHSGQKRDHYVDPYEYAREYLEGLMEPFMEELHRRVQEGRLAEAQSVCMGIVLGLYEHRGGGRGTDEVLGLDPEFPGEAAGAALEVLLSGGPAAHRRKPWALPEQFWERVPAWSRLRQLGSGDRRR
jgi:hypothetical protein